jgi:hypothetical protein
LANGPGAVPPLPPPPLEPPPGTWIEQDVVIPFTLITNGDETSALIIPSYPLVAGMHEIELACERSRWDSATADPEATYQDGATIPLTW